MSELKSKKSDISSKGMVLEKDRPNAFNWETESDFT
jgi:hypothetical protein